MRRFWAAVIALSVVLGGLAARSKAAVYYVSQNASGAEDGSSWDDAFLSIQEALDAADPGDEVWVAEGTYYENLDSSKDLALYGGFAGHESELEERDPSSYTTTLDADQQGRALTSIGPPIRVLDGFEIVNGLASEGDGGGVLLKGFRGVIANVTFRDNAAPGNGGGLSIESHQNTSAASIVLENVTFENNTAARGGGLHLLSVENESSVDIRINGSSFIGNHADTGGGAYVDTSLRQGLSDPELVVGVAFTDAVFSGNSAREGGGAWLHRVYDSDPLYWIADVEFENASFSDNTAIRGGAIHAVCDVEIQSSTFERNGIESAEDHAAGGAIYAIDWNDVFAYNSTFTDNKVSAMEGYTAHGGALAAVNGGGFYLFQPAFTGNSAQDGGALFAGREGRLDVTAGTLRGNSATGRGGAFFARSTDRISLISSVLEGNTAGVAGGAVSLENVSDAGSSSFPPEIRNATITGNSAPVGGGLHFSDGSRVHVFNNIVALNTSGVAVESGAGSVFFHNDVFGNTPGADYAGMADPTGSSGNISQDPLFMDAPNRNYRLAAGSPAIDAGHNWDYRWWAFDLVLAKRVQGTAVDLGAYESAGTPATFLEFRTQPRDITQPGALNPQPVVRVLNADGSVQTSFNLPVQLSLAPWTGSAGAALTGNTTAQAVQGEAAFSSVGIDKAGIGYRLTASVLGLPGFVSDSFTVTANRMYASATGNDANDGASWATAKRSAQSALAGVAAGGEIWLAAGEYRGKLQLRDVSVLGGFAGTETDPSQRDINANVTLVVNDDSDAIDIQSNAGDPLRVDGLHLRSRNGSGVLVFADNVEITRNTFRESAGGFGAGVLTFGHDVLIARNRFLDNQAQYGGGGLCIAGGSVLVESNLFAGNTAPQDGSAITIYNKVPVTIVNNTITGGAGANGAVHLHNSPATLVNNIVANNGSGITRDADSTETVTAHHNLVFGNAAFNYRNMDPGTGDIAAAPLFVDAVGGDWRLAPNSPAVDAGDDAFLSPGARDLAGNPRRVGSHVDMGAFEWLSGGVTLQDAARAMRIAGGLVAATAEDLAPLNVENGGTSEGRVDVVDAARLARQAAGKE